MGAHRYVNANSKRMELLDADVADVRIGQNKCKAIEQNLKAA
jgi:hypothetical protein